MKVILQSTLLAGFALPMLSQATQYYCAAGDAAGGVPYEGPAAPPLKRPTISVTPTVARPDASRPPSGAPLPTLTLTPPGHAPITLSKQAPSVAPAPTFSIGGPPPATVTTPGVKPPDTAGGGHAPPTVVVVPTTAAGPGPIGGGEGDPTHAPPPPPPPATTPPPPPPPASSAPAILSRSSSRNSSSSAAPTPLPDDPADDVSSDAGAPSTIPMQDPPERRHLDLLKRSWLDKGFHFGQGDRSDPTPSRQRVNASIDPLALSASVGLTNTSNLMLGNVSVGFCPGFGERRCPNSPQKINQLLPRPMSVMTAFVSLDADDPNLTTVDYHVPDVLSLDGNPIYHVTLMPNQGLDAITPQVASNIAAKMKQLNSKGITVWLRFAHEMNGDWYAYGNQPDKFVTTWQSVANAVHQQANATYMLWSPNSMFSQSVDDPHGGYTPYWPGQQYVDLVGMSLYSFGGPQRDNIMPAQNQALDAVRVLDGLYGGTLGLPVVISETAAAFTYDPSTGNPMPGSADEHDMKLDWLKQLTDGTLKAAVPSLISINWFEIVKDETSGPGNTGMHTSDFRLLLSEPNLSQSATSFFVAEEQETSSDARPSISL